MFINVHIETHIYSEEEIKDGYFDTPDNSGVLLPDDFAILLMFRDCFMQLEYNQSTTIGDLCEKIINEMIRKIDNPILSYMDFRNLYFSRLNFLTDTQRYSVSNYEANLSAVIKNHLDPDNNGIINVSVLACADAGEVLTQKNLRYKMRSREGNKHNNPHVHVLDIHTRQEASISIIGDFHVLAGSLPSKDLKVALETIKEKQEFFIECWNTLTDGLHVDINYALHLIDY